MFIFVNALLGQSPVCADSFSSSFHAFLCDALNCLLLIAPVLPSSSKEMPTFVQLLNWFFFLQIRIPDCWSKLLCFFLQESNKVFFQYIDLYLSSVFAFTLICICICSHLCLDLHLYLQYICICICNIFVFLFAIYLYFPNQLPMFLCDVQGQQDASGEDTQLQLQLARIHNYT